MEKLLRPVRWVRPTVSELDVVLVLGASLPARRGRRAPAAAGHGAGSSPRPPLVQLPRHGAGQSDQGAHGEEEVPVLGRGQRPPEAAAVPRQTPRAEPADRRIYDQKECCEKLLGWKGRWKDANRRAVAGKESSRGDFPSNDRSARGEVSPQTAAAMARGEVSPREEPGRASRLAASCSALLSR